MQMKKELNIGQTGIEMRMKKDQIWTEMQMKKGPKNEMKCRWIKLWMRLARPRAAQARAGKWKFRQREEGEGEWGLRIVVSKSWNILLLQNLCFFSSFQCTSWTLQQLCPIFTCRFYPFFFVGNLSVMVIMGNAWEMVPDWRPPIVYNGPKV